MRYLIIISSAFLLYSINSFAACSDMISELKAMKSAQASINSSLIANHAMFASTLESYSEATLEASRSSSRALSNSMMSSADSFRNRGLKAQKTAAKLDEATEDLIQRLAKCLK